MNLERKMPAHNERTHCPSPIFN